MKIHENATLERLPHKNHSFRGSDMASSTFGWWFITMGRSSYIRSNYFLYVLFIFLCVKVRNGKYFETN